MNYSEWLVKEFPELFDNSSVKRFNYVKQAKTETKLLRIIANISTFLFIVIMGYSMGYVFGKFTELDLSIVMAVSVGLSVVISSIYLNKIERIIVQKKLTELVSNNT